MPKENTKHRGTILKETIKSLGFKIKDLARLRGVSRGTVYNHFQQADLDDETLLAYGKVMRYDFSIQFPELIPLKQEIEERGLEIYGERTTEELSVVQRRYYKLLEKHSVLMNFLLRMAVEYDFKELREAIADFIKNDSHAK